MNATKIMGKKITVDDPSDGDLLRYNGETHQWESYTPADAGAYTPGSPSDWNETAPTTIQQAIDRLAAANPGA